MNLTYKKESKELETANAVIKLMINMREILIKSEPDNDLAKDELQQLYCVKYQLEQSSDFYYEDL
jgi:hypothetical protein|tara:strand:- start:385 stop:579 length:195 start_codon:yes stop_codon:yes gene_type:complete